MPTPALVTLSRISKSYGEQALFSGLSLSVHEGERVGLIGPNGKGKSTLLKIIAGVEEADSGEIMRKRGLRVVHVEQSAFFPEEQEAFDIVLHCARKSALSEAEALRLTHRAMSDVNFQDFHSVPRTLSGGQRKRLQIASGLCQSPDLLLLDEPTNHLDTHSIVSLEQLLRKAPFAWVVVSHDRWFLENSVSRVAEVNPRYPNGVFSSEGNYSEYRERSAEFLAAEESRRTSLEGKVRNEQEWLSRGPRARATKAKGRTDQAHALIDDLAKMKARQRETRVNLSFASSERETKKLVEFKNVEMSYGEQTIFSGLSLKLMAGQALGVLGRNGSGKSTFVKLLAGDIEPTKGNVKHAPLLKIAHFRQVDSSIAPTTSLKEVFSENGESVVFLEKEVHVSAWASRFGFSFAQLGQPFGSLSGGEQARARLGRIMLETPDVLILDEPTNDLDIPTLEMLEQSLSEFQGALVLVTHDRFMINRLCTHFLGLEGSGRFQLVSDYAQWERELLKFEKAKVSVPQAAGQSEKNQRAKKLSFKDQFDYDSIEQRIGEAEVRLAECEHKLSDDTLQSDSLQLQALCLELQTAQSEVESLYARWEELEGLRAAIAGVEKK